MCSAGTPKPQWRGARGGSQPPVVSTADSEVSLLITQCRGVRLLIGPLAHGVGSHNFLKGNSVQQKFLIFVVDIRDRYRG